MNYQNLIDIYKKDFYLQGDPPVTPRPEITPINGYQMGVDIEPVSTNLTTYNPIGIEKTKYQFDWNNISNIANESINGGVEFATTFMATNDLDEAQKNMSVKDLRQEQKSATLQRTTQGAKTGSQIGSIFGPLGTAIGALGGGLIGSMINKRKQREERKKQLRYVDEAGDKKLTDQTIDRLKQYNYQTKSDRVKAQQYLAEKQYLQLNS